MNYELSPHWQSEALAATVGALKDPCTYQVGQEPMHLEKVAGADNFHFDLTLR